MKQLPDTIQELLELAIADAEVIAKDPRYKLNMGEWHLYNDESQQCEVCIAGAVIARTLKADIKDFLLPADYDDDTRMKLRALDSLWRGVLPYCFSYISIPSSMRVRDPIKTCKRVLAWLKANNINPIFPCSSTT